MKGKIVRGTTQRTLMGKASRSARWRQVVAPLALVLGVTLAMGQSSGGTANRQNGDAGNADQNLKSVARINPSTLAMEFSLPLMNYPGRSGSSLPISLSYSSKVWQMKTWQTWWYTTPIGNYPRFVTDISPFFAERSAAGWTSSLLPPRLDEELELYDQFGKPFDPLLDVANANAEFEQLEATILGNGEETNNLLEEMGYVGCGQACSTYWCEPWGGGYSCSCTRWFFNTATCDFGPIGGTWDDPPPPEPPDVEPTRTMHYVKRIRVQMPDGSSHEFRKDDNFHPYCAGVSNANNGAGCQGQGVDTIGNFLSIDGSGLRLTRTASENILYVPNGGRYFFPVAGGPNWYATRFVDGNGNEMTFDAQALKWTDSLGREVVDPLPHNWASQTQQERIQPVELPGLDNQTVNYQIKWLPLKSASGGESALEDPNQELAYEAGHVCRGNLADTLPPSGSSNEVLFDGGELGIRLCNSYASQGGSVGASLFNPVVLAGIALPNGKTYEFKYNLHGEISKIIYPSGSYERFRYDTILPLSGANSPAFDQTNRGVVERWVYAANDTLEQRWQYSASVNDNQYPIPTGSLYKVTTIASKADDPQVAGMVSESFLVPAVAPVPGDRYGNFGFSDPRAGMPVESRTRDENGVLRTRSLTQLITAPPRPGGDSRAVRDPRVIRTISITIENGQALAVLSEKEYETPGENGSTAPTDPEYFAHLNVKRSKSHHYRSIPLSLAQTGTLEQIAAYFNASSVAAISETDYLYNPDYMARGISSLPIETRSINPEDNSVQAKTQTKYDNLVPNISTGYDYSTETYGLSGDYDCGMVAPNKCWVDPASPRIGRPTTSRLWNKDENTWIETHTKYDIFGNVVKVKDPIGNETSTTLSADYKYAYPTRVDTPAPDPTGVHGTDQGSFSTTTYDFMTGLPLTVTDEFGQTTATEYDDPLLRPTRTYAVNFTAPESQTIYDDNALTVKVRKQIDAVNWDEATTYSDSLGRTIKTVAKDSQGDVIVETKYDFLGRVQMVSNPYRQGDTVYWSLTEYDELGRAKQTREPVENQNPASPTGSVLGVTTYDLSTVQGYFGTVVTSTDAAGRKGRSITNALGQLIVVEEPDSDGNLTALPQGTPQPSPTPTPGGGGYPPPECLMPDPNCGGSNLTSGEYPSYATYYRYDTHGKMVEVTQGVQKRWFKYDSLGRLIRVRQPEQEVNTLLNLADAFNTSGQWTAGFTYDVLGNVLTATDANGVTITNAYDRAGRVKTRTYSDSTPAVSFFYDGKGLAQQQSPNYAKGKLTKVTSSISETQYKLFDNLGNLTEMSQITDGQTYTSKYTYNFSGALVEEEYPSGRKVKNEFESDGDISRIYGNATPTATERTYANTFSYTPDGRIEKLRLGNGLWEKAKFNSRLQVTEMAVGIGVNSGNLWKLGYEYGEIDGNGNVDTAKNTGNVARQTLSFNGLANPFVQTYKYDSLYRLTEARETSNGNQTWKQNFSFDRYGNRLTHEKFSGANQFTHTAVTHPAIDPHTNRFQTGQGYLFDKNGNLTTDAEDRSFVFNGDNKQKEIRDGNDNLVGEYFYDGEGKRIKKKTYDSGVLNEETTFVYSAGKLIAEYSTKPPAQNPTTSWTVTDQLGSPRLLVNALGEVVSRRDFLPFGEEIIPDAANLRTNAALKYNGDGVRQKFTGYQKDEESGLDFAEARMYENRHGRFTAVDPLLASGKPANPQTFNRYVYVLNNPLAFTDPTGLQVATTPTGAWYRPIEPPTDRVWRAQWVTNDQVTPDPSVWRRKSYEELVFQDVTATGRWEAQNPIDGTVAGFPSELEAQTQLYNWTGGANQFYGNETIRQAESTDNFLAKGLSYFVGYGMKLNEESPPGVMMVGIPTSRNLPILNPHFAPNSATVFQNITNTAAGEIASNPALARELLKSGAELTAARNYPYVANMQYGNVVERQVANHISSSPGLHGQLFSRAGGPGRPDFVGVGHARELRFDVTTNHPTTIQRHFARPYGGDDLIIGSYQRPPLFNW